jgi:hypothetical protein
VAALIVWIATAGGGFVLLTVWLARGGMSQQREAGNRIRPPLIMSHFLLAAGGLVLWIVYLLADKDVLAWIARAALSRGRVARVHDVRHLVAPAAGSLGGGRSDLARDA